jgi:hypothetical protein
MSSNTVAVRRHVKASFRTIKNKVYFLFKTDCHDFR